MGTGVEVSANLIRLAKATHNSSIGLRSNDGAHDTHDAVQTDGDTISGSTMSSGQDLGSIGVEATVVDVLQANESARFHSPNQLKVCGV
jgi:hypothetical protein